MKRASLRAGCWLLFCVLGLGFLDTEAIANQNPFEAYSNCPYFSRRGAPTQLVVYRTEQPDQLLVTWDRASASTWRLHGDTAQIRVVVEGAAGFQEQFTALQTSRVLFEDVVGPSPWWVYVATVDRDHIIGDIAVREFDLATLARESDWDRVHRYRQLVPPVPQASRALPGSPSDQTVTIQHGGYDDREQHVEGIFHLTRVGTEVTATFTSAGSAVEPNTVLLTVPPEFRPAAAESREVEGWPVVETIRTNDAGQWSRRHLQLDVLQPVRFQLQVAPSGEVHYRDVPAQAAGDPLAYMLTTTWSTVSEPTVGDLCTRHPAVQAALRQALAAPGQAAPPCGQVTEAALAGVSTLELELGLGHAPLRRKDLAGLHGLRQLTFDAMRYQFPYWPSDLLAGVPGLQSLHLTLVEDELEDPWMDDHGGTFPVLKVPRALRNTLPTLALAGQTRAEEIYSRKWGHSSRKLQAMLAHTPSLRALTVAGHFRRLVPDLLVHTPELQTFVLRGLFSELPAALLAPVPHLRQLTLDSPVFGVLPPDLLAHATELQVLSLRFRDYFKYSPYLRVDWPEGFLQGAPALRELHLSSGVPIILTPDFLDHTPWLEALTVDVHYSGYVRIPDLPDDMLARVPRLHTLVFRYEYLGPFLAWLRHAGALRSLTLDMRSWKQLSPDLLQATPLLQSLTLEMPSLEELPPAFLHHTPQLRSLILDSHRLEQVPPDLLHHTPRLRSLILDLHRLEQVPPDLLHHTPQLESLQLSGPQVPAELLHHVPQLESLQLSGPQVPAELLHHVPRLQSLQLNLWDQTELSADLLKYTPQLKTLQVNAKGLKHLPADFLLNTQDLRTLSLQLPKLDSWPDQLLVALPQLRSLTLDFGYLSELWPPDLLQHSPQLRNLVLDWFSGRNYSQFPTKFLVYTPHLISLTLDGTSLILPPDMLDSVPHLQTLNLSQYHRLNQWNEFRRPSRDHLPGLLLNRLPHLQTLTLDTWCGIPQMPTYVQHVSLRPSCGETDLNWLHYLPDVQILDIEFQSPSLPAGALAYAPRLHTLKLRGNSSTQGLGPDLLLRAPALRQVTLSHGFIGNPGTWLEPDK